MAITFTSRPGLVLWAAAHGGSGGLGMAMPPAKPPGLPTFGSYCFKATCEVYDDNARPRGCPIAHLTGYDKQPTIGKDTEYACRIHVRSLRGKKYRCGEASVVLLPTPSPKMECSGQVFFAMDGQPTKRLF